jgi:cytochrome P450
MMQRYLQHIEAAVYHLLEVTVKQQQYQQQQQKVYRATAAATISVLVLVMIGVPLRRLYCTLTVM